MLCTQVVSAQTLIGKITDADSAHTPLFLAEVQQIQEGKTIATYKTYFDGTYRIKVRPSQNYQLKVSFPGRSDTIVSIAVDKYGTLYTGTLFISLHKDGLRLTGYILDQAQDIPIRDACIILRNVMTRKEEKYTTTADGSYNLKMDYETNYTLKIDKMSPGILNKYSDTSFNISTIGFNKPLDFRLDIRLGPTSGYTAPRPEYDPHAKPSNKNLMPVLMVLGTKDSLLKREQDSVMASISRKLHHKDSVIASLDKRIKDINTNKVALRGSDEEQMKKDEEAARMAQEVRARKKQLEDEQKKKDLAKAEADLKTKQAAEKALQEKLDKQIKEGESIKKEQQRLAVENDQKDKAAARAQAAQDSLLRVAEAKNKEILAHRKHILDSLNTIDAQKAEVKTKLPGENKISQAPDTIKHQPPITAKVSSGQADKELHGLTVEDSLLKIAEMKNRDIMAHRKHVLDSLINIESQRVKIRSDTHTDDQAIKQKDSIRLRKTIEAEKIKKIQADRVQAEQDSLLKIAEAKNKEMMARRKRIQDSIATVEKEQLQAKSNAPKPETEEEKRASELAKLNQAKRDTQMADARRAQTDQDAKRSQLEKDLAAMKKARQEAEARVLAEKREKEAADRSAKAEAKHVAKEMAEQNKKQKQAEEEALKKAEQQQRIAARKAEAENEQRELEAKKALEEQEKNQLTQQLGKLQNDQQSAVTKDQETRDKGYNPDQALKEEKANAINAYQVGILRENKRKADSMAHALSANPGNKVIKAKGFVKNGQTEEPIPNVSINIRRLNSIVSQEVTSDKDGRYDIIVDSGYFYLVSFYKDKYEISKQILDLTSYPKDEYTMVIQYLKESDDFDPEAKMPIVQFEKNSSKLPTDVWGDLESIVKMMKDIPELKMKLYGLASVDEDYPMELSITRARLVADLVLESGIKPARIRINGIGAYRPRSGCTEGKECTDDQYRLDRVVMYRVVKE